MFVSASAPVSVLGSGGEAQKKRSGRQHSMREKQSDMAVLVGERSRFSLAEEKMSRSTSGVKEGQRGKLSRSPLGFLEETAAPKATQ